MASTPKPCLRISGLTSNIPISSQLSSSSISKSPRANILLSFIKVYVSEDIKLLKNSDFSAFHPCSLAKSIELISLSGFKSVRIPMVTPVGLSFLPVANRCLKVFPPRVTVFHSFLVPRSSFWRFISIVISLFNSFGILYYIWISYHNITR